MHTHTHVYMHMYYAGAVIMRIHCRPVFVIDGPLKLLWRRNGQGFLLRPEPVSKHWGWQSLLPLRPLRGFLPASITGSPYCHPYLHPYFPPYCHSDYGVAPVITTTAHTQLSSPNHDLGPLLTGQFTRGRRTTALYLCTSHLTTLPHHSPTVAPHGTP